MCDADVSRLCHHVFLRARALKSGPFLQNKKYVWYLVGLACACGILQGCKDICISHDGVILFYAVLREPGAGGLYILYNTEPSHEAILLERCVGSTLYVPSA